MSDGLQRRNDEGKLERTNATVSPWAPPSPFTTVSLTQSRTTAMMLEYVAKHSDIAVERAKLPRSISISKDESEHPVTVSVQRMQYSNGDGKMSRNDNDIHENDVGKTVELSEEIIKAKYIIGCDGAHSWTRKQFDIASVGDDSDIIWGVLDIVPITNFRE